MGDLLSRVFGLVIKHKVEYQEVPFIMVNKQTQVLCDIMRVTAVAVVQVTKKYNCSFLSFDCGTFSF